MKLLKNYQPSYSDSALARMTKEELIEQIRILEHNIGTQVECIENQKKYMERLIAENQRKLTLRTALKALATYCESFNNDCKRCELARGRTCALYNTLPCEYEDSVLFQLSEKGIPIEIEEEK